MHHFQCQIFHPNIVSVIFQSIFQIYTRTFFQNGDRGFKNTYSLIVKQKKNVSSYGSPCMMCLLQKTETPKHKKCTDLLKSCTIVYLLQKRHFPINKYTSLIPDQGQGSIKWLMSSFFSRRSHFAETVEYRDKLKADF